MNGRGAAPKLHGKNMDNIASHMFPVIAEEEETKEWPRVFGCYSHPLIYRHNPPCCSQPVPGMPMAGQWFGTVIPMEATGCKLLERSGDL